MGNKYDNGIKEAGLAGSAIDPWNQKTAQKVIDDYFKDRYGDLSAVVHPRHIPLTGPFASDYETLMRCGYEGDDVMGGKWVPIPNITVESMGDIDELIEAGVLRRTKRTKSSTND